MSNQITGEVRFNAGDTPYVLAFTINALCELEKALGGISVSEIGAQMGDNMRISTLRTVFWAGLLAHHNVTEEEAGDLITALGAAQAGQLIGEAFKAAFPEAGKSTGRPQKAAAGTGKRS